MNERGTAISAIMILILIAAGAVMIFADHFQGSVGGTTESLGDYYVSASGSDNNDGLSWTSAFVTIQHAVDVATPGDIVLVGDGMHAGDIDVDKGGLTIQSENGPANTIVWVGCSAFSVIENNVVINGFTIGGESTFPTAPRWGRCSVSVGISVRGNGCRILNNTVYEEIYLDGANNNTVENNILRYGADISLRESHSNTIRNNDYDNAVWWHRFEHAG